MTVPTSMVRRTRNRGCGEIPQPTDDSAIIKSVRPFVDEAAASMASTRQSLCRSMFLVENGEVFRNRLQ